MPRTRTTKKLAQRIDLDYFRRASPLRSWRLWLSIAAPALALVLVGWYGVRADRRVYSAGALASSHAVLTKQCSACHVSNLGFYDAKVIDQKCLACHDGAIHHITQEYTPSCASCHTDHRGTIRLAATSDANCTQCHADLTARGGAAGYARNVTSFEANHPEFAAVRPGSRDAGTIQVNHYVHLQANLLGPNGARVQMVCSDCHRSAADSAGPWPYGESKNQSTESSKAAAANENSAGAGMAAPPRAYMAPATYAETCAACHTLQFDKSLADAVPHDKPEVVHAFVVAKLQAYIAVHPSDLRVARDPSRELPEQPIPADYRLLTPAQWVAERIAQDEALLWRKTCKQCHTIVAGADGALPKIAPSKTTSRYMMHANFDHSQHGLVDCAACHAAAAASQQSSDVLLPGIATCRACHHSGTEAAEARCFECHNYHDPAARKPAHSSFSLAQFANK